ncbi:MAG: hypothetical protein BGO98_49425 [Myxococcales bacterium 68-20]|nr:hypothetical protein [Myxococcales bacterium]OJY29842.1 MAG: hypothetical protein BGO98_49425 [Myxococcales bacterium 68-20]
MATALSLLVGAFLCASAARAQVPGEEIARRAFEDGVALEKKGDFAAALAKFKESEQIKATLGNRYHKAYCLEMTGKLAAALIEYEVVDKAARESNKTDLVEATRLRLEPLRTRVPQLSLQLAAQMPKETEVALDGTPVSPALLDGKRFRLDPGDHVVTARAAAHESFTKRFTAAESTVTSVEIVLQTANAATSTDARAKGVDSAKEPLAEPPRERSIALPLLTTVGAVVLAAGGVASFVIAAGESDNLEKVCALQPRPVCEGDRTPPRAFDALALGSWIGAAGLAALSVVLWTSSPSSSSSQSASNVRVLARSSWLGLEGRF